MRRDFPGIRVIVHPECRFEVTQAADQIGSTEGIIKAVTGAAPGSKWAVGTEIHLVNRLGKEFPDRKVMSLDQECVRLHHDVPHHAESFAVGAGKSGGGKYRESDFRR